MSLTTLIPELRRRNVIRTALAYLAVAWLVIQLVNEIGPILDAPEGLPKLVLVLLSAGFVVVVVLSWFYEFTTAGIRSAGDVARDDTLRSAGGRKMDFFIIGALVLAAGYFAWESRFRPDPGPAGDIRSIAVLPFRDLSSAQDQAWFADGMAEELLNALSRVPGLRVAGRTSSFTFRNTDLAPDVVAEQLNVSHLLEGGIRTSGNEVRVTAQLVDARDGLLLWSDEFEGQLSEVFAFQDEISHRVVESLTASIDAPAVRTKTDAEAYKAYLLGRYQLARRTAGAIAEAEVHFKTAVELDPRFSPAWSALATTLAVSPWYAPVANTDETARQAREAAQRALALDSANSEAWAALGTVYQTFDRDWENAERALQRAVELDPDDAGTANLYGDFAYITGDYDAAEHWEGIAAGLEPLSAVHQHELALVYGLTGRLAEAIALERKAIALNPEFSNGWHSLGRFYAQSRDAARLEELLRSRGTAMGELPALLLGVWLHELRGEAELARSTADAFLELARAKGGSLVPTALAYALLGDGPTAADLVLEAQGTGDPLLISPIYFFLPEDWSEYPDLERALTQPDLAEVHDRRRANIAAGRGRERLAPQPAVPGAVGAAASRDWFAD